MQNIDVLKLHFAAWEKTLDAQMHFNDLCLRIRSFAISILGVFLGSAAIAYKFAGHLEVADYMLPAAAVFLGVSLIVWTSFYLMDRFWYHELLKGAVNHGRELEDLLSEQLPGIGLAHAIRRQSHSALNMNAAKKLTVFYGMIFLVQFIGLLVLIFGATKATV